ncbi:hypothetical protein CAEBREN_03854 [Caenorhabditis brenneri]|uniref:Uncharacterized protein n=1 Tax=Caenorhabditis brenneri TaxID=135651 RepID=G0P0C5_CAEBE|nr:hypothetical protein CAEBREN_03854 [Caenorhabditis brenneri]
MLKKSSQLRYTNDRKSRPQRLLASRSRYSIFLIDGEFEKEEIKIFFPKSRSTNLNFQTDNIIEWLLQFYPDEHVMHITRQDEIIGVQLYSCSLDPKTSQE